MPNSLTGCAHERTYAGNDVRNWAGELIAHFPLRCADCDAKPEDRDAE